MKTPTVWLVTVLWSWMRDRRGSVTTEFVLGAVLIVMTVVAGLELYQVVHAQSTVLRAAVTMADYVSLEDAPSVAHIQDLARFSHHNEIGKEAKAVFVISAARRLMPTPAQPDPPAVVVWKWNTAMGPDPDSALPPEPFTGSCGVLGAAGSPAPALQTDLDMLPGEMVVIVEVCVDVTERAFVTGGLLPDSVLPKHFYQRQILPVRGHVMPAEPS